MNVHARQLARELRAADEASRVMDYLGRAVVTATPAQAEAWAEAAIERASIQDEGGPARRSRPSGLVSVPTSGTRTAADAVELRKAVRGFSPDLHKSRIAKLRRSVGFAARGHLLERAGFRPDRVFMVTLTYAADRSVHGPCQPGKSLPDGQWRPRDVSSYLQAMRLWLRRRGHPCRYVWVAELQQRGAVHYHVALWLPAGVYLPSADVQGWWTHGSTRTERARAAVPYLMKYLSKGGAPGSFSLPDGARMYGVGGLDHSIRRAARWLRLPGFVRSRSDCFDKWSPALGGGWADPEGVVIPSEFQRAWVGDAWGLVRVADYGRPFAADGPFTWLHRRPEVTQ